MCLNSYKSVNSSNSSELNWGPLSLTSKVVIPYLAN